MHTSAQRAAHEPSPVPGMSTLQKLAIREWLLEIFKQLWPAYLLASILILYGFHWSLPSAYQDKSFQADENAAVWAVNQIHFPHLNPHWFAWGTGLFYQVYLLKVIFTLGGLFHASDYWILVIGRLVVFASALGAITTLFVLARKMLDPWTARLAAILLAVLPGFVINAHYFKTDVPMTFWMLVTMVAAYQLIEAGTTRDVLLLGLLVGYTASIKYSAGVLLFVGLLALWMARRKFQRKLSWTSYLLCVGAGFAFGEPIVLRPGNWKEILGAIRWVGRLNTLGVPYHLGRPPAWLDYPIHVMPYAMTLPMLLAATIAFVWAVIRKRSELLPILVFLAIYYPLLARDNWRLVRYTVPLLPFAALFVAALIAHLRKQRLIGTISHAAAYAIALYAFLFSFSYVRVMAQTDPRNQALLWSLQHLSREQPVPQVGEYYANFPQFALAGYKVANVGYSIADLRSAESPYLVVSEYSTAFYGQAIGHWPEQEKFLAYVNANYSEVVHFENSQRLLFIDSKAGANLSQDWLHPNPRITILIRRSSP
jgi:hypothetical protein